MRFHFYLLVYDSKLRFTRVLVTIDYRGVILMRLEHAGKIQSASLISATETESEEDVIEAIGV